jgi:hypothetical protein
LSALIRSLDDLWRNKVRVFGHRIIDGFWVFDLGENNHLFTVMLFHDGFFARSGYVDGKPANFRLNGKPAWFDYCDVNWLSIPVVNDIVEDLGYAGGARVKLYWCLPGKMLSDSGVLHFF